MPSLRSNDNKWNNKWNDNDNKWNNEWNNNSSSSKLLPGYPGSLAATVDYK